MKTKRSACRHTFGTFIFGLDIAVGASMDGYVTNLFFSVLPASLFCYCGKEEQRVESAKGCGPDL